MKIAASNLTEPLPWIRCQIGLLEGYDFICPDCGRPICYDHGEQLVDYVEDETWSSTGDEADAKIWVCVECVNGETWYPVRGISEEPDEPLTIDSKTGMWVNLVTSDQERNREDEIHINQDGIDRLQRYINLLKIIFE